MMRALAWDDDPDGYMKKLSELLFRTAKISMQIEHDPNDFVVKFQQQEWDFIVTDLVDESDGAGGQAAKPGVLIAQRYADKVPVYVVTSYYDAVSASGLGIPDNVLVKSKSLNPSWMAVDIVDDLKRRGVFVDHHRVFIIYGHDRTIDALHTDVEKFLNERGLAVEWVKGANLGTEILNGLLQKMNRCAAFIAICTPDDPVVELTDNSAKIIHYQPRQNVLFEMGVAMGLSRGIQRLIVLKKWGPTINEQAKLPSDFGGVLTIRVENDFATVVPQLVDRLKQLNVAIKYSTQTGTSPVV